MSQDRKRREGSDVEVRMDGCGCDLWVAAGGRGNVCHRRNKLPSRANMGTAKVECDLSEQVEDVEGQEHARKRRRRNVNGWNRGVKPEVDVGCDYCCCLTASAPTTLMRKETTASSLLDRRLGVVN